ncbi:hypothetical protein [Streptomyces sp. NPDC088789]|uniref:hypothetical protein n=1 Tax=Streptomyces sp. NPDC088789 TaxID=3365899 RepID=UPI00382493C9
MTDRPTASTITDQQLDQLHEQLEHTETTLARVRAVRDQWARNTLEPGQVRRLIDALTTALDHPSQQSAERARDRHTREEHTEDTMTTTPCTATIEGPHVLGDGPIQCTREAGHPENHVGPQLDSGKTLWTDSNAGAVPHKANGEEQDSA